jgi:hypothetical protein
MPDLAFPQFAGAALMPVAAGASQPGWFLWVGGERKLAAGNDH